MAYSDHLTRLNRIQAMLKACEALLHDLQVEAANEITNSSPQYIQDLPELLRKMRDHIRLARNLD